MACHTLSLAKLPPRGHQDISLQPRNCRHSAGTALQEAGALLLQVERGRQRHSQRGLLMRPQSHSKSVAELEPWRPGSWTSNAPLWFFC